MLNAFGPKPPGSRIWRTASGKQRLEAFTDGVLAVIIAIMVLELKVPARADFSEFVSSLPVFLAYALSFLNAGIFWNNHHHMLHVTERINGTVLWANLFLLFSMSLVPRVIRWMDETKFAGTKNRIESVARRERILSPYREFRFGTAHDFTAGLAEAEPQPKPQNQGHTKPGSS